MKKTSKKDRIRSLLEGMLVVLGLAVIAVIIASVVPGLAKWRNDIVVISSIISGILACMCWILLKSLDGLPKRVTDSWDRPKPGPVLIDLRTSNEGMSCDDFSFLVVAGPETEKMPESVEKRIRIHQATCIYHQSPAFWKGVAGVPVTPEMEKAALALVAKMEKDA